MGFSKLHGVHISHQRAAAAAPAPASEPELTKRDSTCTFYLSPKMGDTIDSLAPLPITWDPSCLSSTSTKEIDIYLYSPGSDLPRIHVWQNVALSRGTYEATLMPRWWNATASQSLQINVVPAGEPTFLSTLPGGPVFTATYTAPAGGGTPLAADTTQIDSGITMVNDNLSKSALTPGKKAAAVILPLLFVGLVVGAYIKMKRSRGKDKRRKWTEAVDKRMSTISTDWKSVSGAGAKEAIRNSMAVAGNRNSSFSFGALRPSSTFATEGEDGGAAGVGLGHKQKEMQMRTGTGVGLRNPAGLTSTSTTSVDRVSRVSFAPDTRLSTSRVSFADSRPSGESRRTRAFHSAYIPPVPALPVDESGNDEVDEKDEREREENRSEESGSFSPRQTQGALTLTPEDIRSRIVAGRARAASNANAAQQQAFLQQQQQQQQQYAGQQYEQYGQGQGQQQDEKASGGAGFDEFMPALSMMRTGNDPAAPDDFLFSSSSPSGVNTPVSPPPAYPKSVGSTPVPSFTSQQMTYAPEMSSPVMSSMPMQPMPANVMSPDEMLRAYAERKKVLALASASASSGRASPASSNSNSNANANANSGAGFNGGRARTPSIKAAISYPMPVVNHAGMGMGGRVESNMRVLYEAAVPVPEVPLASTTANNNGNRMTNYTESQYAESEYTAESYAVHGQGYGQSQGQAQLGHHANASIGVGMYGGARYAIGDEDEDERVGVNGSVGRAA